jgi:N-dimethylarginine dimethylaminohydrolase
MLLYVGIKNPEMNFTCHSEIGKIKSLFIKNVQHAFISDSHLEQHWRSLNYLGKPDMGEARKEYKLFQSILENHVSELFFFPEDITVNMDSIYCRDASIATNKGMIICNMGKVARSHEPQAEKNAFEKKAIPILGTIIEPGTVEGGDVAWLDEQTLAVGHTYRTNDEGIRQLKTLLKPLGVDVIVVPLPHYKGKADVFHLMSIFSPVDTNLAVVYSPLMPITFRNYLLERGYQLLELTDEEFDSMGCNVLAMAPRQCLLVKGNPVIKLELENAGCVVSVYQGEEISVKGGGGPTCLTRPIHRWI